jgi:hypothetical protein
MLVYIDFPTRWDVLLREWAIKLNRGEGFLNYANLEPSLKVEIKGLRSLVSFPFKLPEILQALT